MGKPVEVRVLSAAQEKIIYLNKRMLLIDVQELKKGTYKNLLPEVYELKKITENNSWHKSQNLFDHTIETVTILSNIISLKMFSNKKFLKNVKYKFEKRIFENYKRKDLIMISAILHDIGKPITLIINNDETTACPLHEIVGSSLIDLFSKRFLFSKKEELYVKKIVEYHTLFIDIQNQIMKKGKKMFYFNIYDNLSNEIKVDLILLHLADLLASDLKRVNFTEFEYRKKMMFEILELYYATDNIFP